MSELELINRAHADPEVRGLSEAVREEATKAGTLLRRQRRRLGERQLVGMVR
jgi:hypothetical protein